MYYKKLNAFTLIEALVSLTILSMVLPALFTVFLQIQSIFYKNMSQVELENDLDMSLQKVSQDIKGSISIFEDQNSINLFSSNIAKDAVSETHYTKSDGSDASAILLMKYIGKENITINSDNFQLSKYKLIAYYLSLNKDLSNNRILTKLETKKYFLDSSILNNQQINYLKSLNYLLWSTPKTGFLPQLPNLDNIEFTKNYLNSDIALNDVIVDGKKGSLAGGFLLKKNQTIVDVLLIVKKRKSGGFVQAENEADLELTSLIK